MFWCNFINFPYFLLNLLRYSINCQIIGGFDRRIYDVDLRSPGSFHDARIWKFSHAKVVIERRFPRYLLAGDQGYPKSEVLVIPYSDEEALHDPSKRLFNMR